MKLKCKLKYFWNGFTSVFQYRRLDLCPFCCQAISSEEYHSKCTFVLGCSQCRNKQEDEICERWKIGLGSVLKSDTEYIKRKMEK